MNHVQCLEHVSRSSASFRSRVFSLVLVIIIILIIIIIIMMMMMMMMIYEFI